MGEWQGRTYEPIAIAAKDCGCRYDHEKKPTGTVEKERWAATFLCPNHGTCTDEMVTTKKTCLWCGAGLIRDGGYPEDLPWLAAAASAVPADFGSVMSDGLTHDQVRAIWPEGSTNG